MGNPVVRVDQCPVLHMQVLHRILGTHLQMCHKVDFGEILQVLVLHLSCCYGKGIRSGATSRFYVIPNVSASG